MSERCDASGTSARAVSSAAKESSEKSTGTTIRCLGSQGADMVRTQRNRFADSFFAPQNNGLGLRIHESEFFIEFVVRDQVAAAFGGPPGCGRSSRRSRRITGATWVGAPSPAANTCRGHLCLADASG